MRACVGPVNTSINTTWISGNCVKQVPNSIISPLVHVRVVVTHCIMNHSSESQQWSDAWGMMGY